MESILIGYCNRICHRIESIISLITFQNISLTIFNNSIDINIKKYKNIYAPVRIINIACTIFVECIFIFLLEVCCY
jgi:hypothetical protein